MHGIATVAEANRFLREHYIAEFNRRFRVRAAQRGLAFLPCKRKDLDLVFSLQFERTVNRDNTVSFQNLTLQIERVEWKATLAGCTVTVHQHLDGTLSLTYGPHRLARYTAEGVPITATKTATRGAVEKTLAPPPWKTLRVSHALSKGAPFRVALVCVVPMPLRKGTPLYGRHEVYRAGCPPSNDVGRCHRLDRSFGYGVCARNQGIDHPRIH